MVYNDSPRLLRPSQVARLYNISIQQLRNLEKSGVLRAYRHGPKGWRRFRPEDIEAYLGLPNDLDNSTEERRFFYYARVSTKSQSLSGGLQNQIARLKEYAREKYGVDDLEGLSDVASGISVDRDGFSKLIDFVCADELKGATILCTYKDRLMRLNGHGLVERICGHHGVTIEYIDEEDEKGADEELADEILRIITHFSAKKHGQRGGDAVRIELAPETVRLIFSLYQQKLSVVSIVKHCEQHGITSTKGKRISNTKVYEVLRNSELAEQLLGKVDTLSRWLRECCKQGKKQKATSGELWQSYLDWAKVNNFHATTQTYFSMWLKKRGFKRARMQKEPKLQRRFFLGVGLKSKSGGTFDSFAKPGTAATVHAKPRRGDSRLVAWRWRNAPESHPFHFCRPSRARCAKAVLISRGLHPWLLTVAPAGLFLFEESTPNGPRLRQMRDVLA